MNMSLSTAWREAAVLAADAHLGIVHANDGEQAIIVAADAAVRVVLEGLIAMADGPADDDQSPLWIWLSDVRAQLALMERTTNGGEHA